jgi:rubrerythrin
MKNKTSGSKKVTHLEFVLDFEKKGAILYLDLARKTQNPLGKRLFYSLAGEEVQHAGRADEIHSQVHGKPSAEDKGNLPTVETKLKQLFHSISREAARKNVENTEGYELALKMEKKGYEIYKGFLNEAETGPEKDFFVKVLDQEKEHIEAISNVLAYFTGAGDWLQEEESKTWNWMSQ